MSEPDDEDSDMTTLNRDAVGHRTFNDPDDDELVESVFPSTAMIFEHDDHLRADGDDLCVPSLREESRAGSVRLTGAPVAGPYIGDDSLDAHEVTLEDGTRLYVEGQYLAHSRECASTSCIVVWRRNALLAHRYALHGPWFRMFGLHHHLRRGDDSLSPHLVARDKYAWVSTDADFADLYPIAPHHADRIRAARIGSR